jgi:hypothetical protein
LNYKSKLLYPFLATNMPCIMGIYNMHFNSLLLSFCKFCDNLWCIGKLDVEIHINLNQMRTFEIITLNPNHTWNWIHFNNHKPIPYNGHELRKINWIISKSFRIFKKNSQNLTQKVIKFIKYIMPRTILCSLQNQYPQDTNMHYAMWI